MVRIFFVKTYYVVTLHTVLFVHCKIFATHFMFLSWRKACFSIKVDGGVLHDKALPLKMTFQCTKNGKYLKESRSFDENERVKAEVVLTALKLRLKMECFRCTEKSFGRCISLGKRIETLSTKFFFGHFEVSREICFMAPPFFLKPQNEVEWLRVLKIL